MRDKPGHALFTSQPRHLLRFILLVLALACALLLVPSAKAHKLLAAEGESHYTQLDGARVHYKSFGTGREALVLIHG